MPLLSLPPELLTHILSSSSSHASLLALATTCRRFYVVFHRDRPALIYAVLSTELGVALPDALEFAALLTLDIDKHDHLVRLGEVLETYKTDLWGSGGDDGGEREIGPAPQRVGEELVMRMLKAHRNISFLAGVFGECALMLLATEAKPGCADPAQAEILVAPLSEVERVRILRAHYRLALQLRVTESMYYWLSRDPDASRFLHIGLLAQWEMWEVQQVFSAGAFLETVLNPRLRHDRDLGSAIEECRRRLPFSAAQDKYMTPREFVKQLCELDEAAWREVLRRSSSFTGDRGGAVSRGSSGQQSYIDHLSNAAWKRGYPERHRFPVTFRFACDTVHSAPLGWVDAFDGYCDFDFWAERGSWLSREPAYSLWYRTGFVMWDSPRVKAMKASLLLQRCKTGWACRRAINT